MKDEKKNTVDPDGNIPDVPPETPPAENKTEPPEANPADEPAENQGEKAQAGEKPRQKKRKAPSGAYWYTLRDDAELVKYQQIRTLIHVIALMLQLVVLVMPQEGLEYVTKYISSYAFVYMWAVFITLGASVYIIIMDIVRNKIQKRIPVERAPKNGFKKRAYFTTELDIAVNAVIFVMELSFVCIHYDGFGLLSMFITAAATGTAVWARMLEHLILKDAELIPPPDANSNAADDDGNTDDKK